VDDGSTDDTRQVAARAGATLVSQANAGLSEARNAGLRASYGDLVVMLDADDELLPDAIAIGVEAFARRPRAVAVFGRCRAINAEGQPLPAQYHDIHGGDLYREWLARNFVWTPGAAMFRRGALEGAGGFPPGLGPVADYAVYLRLARTGEVVLHTREVVRYRQHEGSMSRDPVMMLGLTLQVLRNERRAAPAYAADIRKGARAWRRWYGERMLRQLRIDIRARRFGRAQGRLLLALIRYAPGLLLTHAGRALVSRARVLLDRPFAPSNPHEKVVR